MTIVWLVFGSMWYTCYQMKADWHKGHVCVTRKWIFPLFCEDLQKMKKTKKSFFYSNGTRKPTWSLSLSHLQQHRVFSLPLHASKTSLKKVSDSCTWMNFLSGRTPDFKGTYKLRNIYWVLSLLMMVISSILYITLMKLLHCFFNQNFWIH